MSPEEQDNPYKHSSTDAEPSTPRKRRRPGLVTILIVAAASILAAVCGFFVSCFGIAIAAENSFSMTLEMLFGMSFLAAFIAFVAVWFIGMRLMN